MKKFLLFFLLLACPLFSEDVLGRVVGVTDGDTIKIASSGVLFKVRLYGIDAPEKHQAYGQKAKQHLSDLCFGRDVKLTIVNKDRYGRFVGKVYVEGKCVNEIMVEDGFAWAYRQYLKKADKDVYAAMEQVARNRGLGLWADKSPVEPWKFRRKK